MKENFLSIEREQFKAFQVLPIEGPLFMYNLLKFKKEIPDSEFSGAQVYRQYLRATNPFFQKANAEVVFMGSPVFTLIGPGNDDYWDEILIVKYQSKNDFIGMITAEGYPAELREKALEDSRLVFCKSHQK